MCMYFMFTHGAPDKFKPRTTFLCSNWFLYIIGLTSAELEKLFLNTLIFFAHFKNVLA